MAEARASWHIGAGLIIPSQALIGIVIAVPLLYVLWLSFQSSTYGSAATFTGIDNYVRVLTDPYFWRALLNTVIVVAIVVHVELLLGLGIALLLASGIPLRPLVLTAILAPYAVTEVSAVVMWRFLFDYDVGLGTQLLQFLGLPALEYATVPLHGLFTVSMLSVWLNLPFTVIILYAARLSVPEELYEAARVDGASGFAQFRSITLPLLVPAMLIAIIFRYIIAFRMFSEVWLLTGGGPARQTEVLAVYLYKEAFSFNQFGAASATGLLMVVACLALAVWYLRQMYRQMFR